MPDTASRPWATYAIISIGIIGIILLLRWSFSHRGGNTSDITAVIDNQIIISDKIPSSCQSIKDTMTCIITQSKDSNFQTSLVNYYRETLSTWNNLPTDKLDTTCNESLSYIKEQITMLSGTYSSCLSGKI